MEFSYKEILESIYSEVSVLNRELQYEYIHSEKIKTAKMRQFLIGKDDYEYCRQLKLSEEIAKRRVDYLRMTLNDGSLVQYEEEFIDTNFSEKQYYTIRISPILDEKGNIKGLIRYSMEITHCKKAEQKIAYIANHDELTELPNRRCLYEKLTLQEYQYVQGYNALLLIDLDRFKTINDSLGHTIGDFLIQSVANRLNQIFQKNLNVNVYRFGGDEFIITIKDITKKEIALKFCQKIVDTFQSPFLLDDKELFIQTSLGIYFFEKEELKDINQIIMCADTAMYNAKESGRNTYVEYTPGMANKNEKILQLETDIYRAYKSNKFIVYYQPRIDILSRTIVAAEALIRWQDNSEKIYPPSYFIEIAEKSGILEKIGMQVIPQIIKQAGKWLVNHPNFKLAINFSRSQFYNKRYLGLLDRAIQNGHFKYEHLIIELKENIIMEKPLESIQILNEMHKRGILIAIDDFGSDYSSLSQLKNYPIDIINIGRSFTKNITEDYQDTAIITAIVSMAHKLNLSVNVEGIESIEQFGFLAYLKCQTAQGFLISRPLPLEEFQAIIARKTKFL